MIVPAQLEQHERRKAIQSRVRVTATPSMTSAKEIYEAGFRAGQKQIRDLMRAKGIYDLEERIEAQKARLAMRKLEREGLSRFDRAKALLTLVAHASDMSVEEIKAKRRNPKYTTARHVAMWLCRKNTSCSFPDIGRVFGGYNHSTVMHACEKADRLIASGSLPESLMALVREGK